jgi:hypothetical protein
MNQRTASTLGYIGSVAAATLAAALMTGNAFAEGPIDYPQSNFTSSLSRAEVKAQLMQDRQQVSSYGSEWMLQQQAALPRSGATTREQVRADYIASRDEVHARTAEDSGSSYVARMPERPQANKFAASER